MYRAFVALYTKLPAGRCLTHVGREGRGRARAAQKMNEAFKEDCERLGIKVRNQHATRHTFITLGLQHNRGAEESIKALTHRKKGRDAFDKYDHVVRWDEWCEAVARIPVRLKLAGVPVIGLRSSA
jgi:integrase